MEENPFKSTIQRIIPMEKKKSIVLDWLKIPQPKRIPRNPKDLAKQLGIDIQIITEWTAEAKIQEQKLKTETKVQERKDKAYTSKDYFLSRKREIDEAAADACIKRPNSQLFTAIKKLTGELVEKQEVTHKGFTADDIDKINKKADAELEEFYRSLRTGGIQEV